MSKFCCLVEHEWDLHPARMPTYAPPPDKRAVQMHAGVDGEDGTITPLCGRQVDPELFISFSAGFKPAYAIAKGVPMCPACEIEALSR